MGWEASKWGHQSEKSLYILGLIFSFLGSVRLLLVRE